MMEPQIPLGIIKKSLGDAIALRQQCVADAIFVSRVQNAALLIARSLKDGGKLLIFGNGGSAADAQHIAAEFTGRYKIDRQPLAAIALTTDTSALTAIANDYGYDFVFRRQIQAFGKASDVALGITTSGRSRNVLAGLEAAQAIGMNRIALTGEDGLNAHGGLAHEILIPSKDTARIQEMHITVGHILTELVEYYL